MLYVIIIVVSLLLSCFFSGTETAFVSVNNVRVELWRRRKDRIAEVIHFFLEKPEGFLYTTLIGNNIFNVAYASFATIYFNRYLPPEISWLIIVISNLFFGEIIPKTLFRSLADWIIRKISYPLKFFYYLLFPISVVISRVAEVILKPFGYQKDEVRQFFSTKDIEILLAESQEMVKRKAPDQGEFLSAILGLRELWVRDAMVPRTEIVAVPATATLEELTEIFNKYGHTKVPVYNGTLDDIVGVAFLKDLFSQPVSLQEMIRPVMFVPETKRCSDLFSEFRARNTTIAIVFDEYGGTAGLITSEDLVEELFGDIEDEYDEQEVKIRQIDEKIYKVNARIEIERLNETLNINLPEGDYETLAGFLLTRLGHVPRRDETYDYTGIQMVVTKATRRKIQWVKIVLPDRT
jgi:CBS domain containing-hemolysin-like protein